MWHDQSSLIDAQQNDQPELQITLQEVIGMIDNTAHEETMGDDVRHEETMGDDVRHEETMGDDVRHEETMGDDVRHEETICNNGLIGQFRILICYKRSCSSPELRPQLCGS